MEGNIVRFAGRWMLFGCGISLRVFGVCQVGTRNSGCGKVLLGMLVYRLIGYQNFELRVV